MTEKDIRRAIGLADACELMRACFAYPDERVSEALVDGAFSSDLCGSLEDAGFEGADGASGLLSGFSALGTDECLSRLRRGSSFLYFAPEKIPPVFPFESAFRFVMHGREGSPVIMSSPVTADVELHMREAGVLPKTARREPADSVWDEFSFMSYLYGQVAKSLYEGRADEAAEWADRIVRFWDDHASKWLPAFMEKTIEEAPKRSYGAEYGTLAQVGLVVLSVVAGDVESKKRA